MNKHIPQNLRSSLPPMLVLLVVVLAIRIIPYYTMIFSGGGPAIFDPDGCYHLRRAELFLHNLPAIPVFDSYINFPHGAYIIWPPLYDLLLACVWALSLPFTGGGSLPVTLPFLPPLFLGLAALVVYRTGLLLWPAKRWYAFGSALPVALLPISVLYSFLGEMDHHAAEILCVALFLHFLIKSTAQIAASSTAYKSWLLTGLCLGLGLLVQHGLLLLEAVLFLGLLPLLRGSSRSRAMAMATVINTTAFCLILPFGLYCHLHGVPLAHTHFGLFQPLVVLCLALLSGALGLLITPRPEVRKPWMLLAGTVAACLGVTLLVILLRQTMAGTAYLVRTWSGWQAQIAESHSLLRSPPGKAAGELLMYMSGAVFLLPLCWVVMIKNRHRLRPQEWTILLSSILFTLFGLLQMRFLTYLTLLLGLIVVYGIRQLRDWVKPRTLLTGAACIILGIAYIPCIGSIGGKDVTYDVYHEMGPLLKQLRDIAPPDSLYYHPDTPPPAGIIADWNLGHYIQYYGHWPVLADNFGEHATDLSRLNRFFFSTENESTYRFLDENRVRYVITQDLPSMYQSMILDTDMLAYVSTFDPATGIIQFDPAIYPTVLCRLVWRYGGAFLDRERALYSPPLDRLRLAGESRGKDQTLPTPEVARIKLFEYVPGARLLGTGFSPLTGVNLQTRITTPHGRTFPYIQFLNSTDDGHLSATLPYATEDGGSIHAAPYSLIIRNDVRELPAVTEEMIQTAGTLEVYWE